MTILVARPPLQVLSMSAMQVGSRRLSARLQEKDDAQSRSSGTTSGGIASKEPGKQQSSGLAASKKRKNDYDEDDDGFTFSRVKSKKARQNKRDMTPQTDTTSTTTTAAAVAANGSNVRATTARIATETGQPPSRSEPEATHNSKKRKKMSFSTPKVKESQPVRRSNRLSSEMPERSGSPIPNAAPIQVKSRKKRKTQEVDEKLDKGDEGNANGKAEDLAAPTKEVESGTYSVHAGTKIALPFADTPVNRRNKAMRKEKSMRGDRRSSLASRGQRASSLFETGNSYALPHQELEVTDFYKHIGSGLMEPRRMQQLLTWCASRAMHAKPVGTDFADSSAKSAARIIEEELLKELSDKSELSNWFNREDVSEPAKPLPERPNPKNVQNMQKIAELEQQVHRLKEEKDALQNLLQPPKIVETGISEQASIADIDRSLLSDEDIAILDALNSAAQLPEDVSRRVNDIGFKIGPQIDAFADTIHKVAQYRSATDKIADKILSKCANNLADREKAGRRKALHTDEDRSPGRDLSNILRGLSKADR